MKDGEGNHGRCTDGHLVALSPFHGTANAMRLSKASRGESTKEEDNKRLDQLELFVEPTGAVGNLGRRGPAITAATRTRAGISLKDV